MVVELDVSWVSYFRKTVQVLIVCFFLLFSKTNNKSVQDRQKGPAVLILFTAVGPIMLLWSQLFIIGSV